MHSPSAGTLSARTQGLEEWSKLDAIMRLALAGNNMTARQQLMAVPE
jgi:hypothetical protein